MFGNCARQYRVPGVAVHYWGNGNWVDLGAWAWDGDNAGLEEMLANCSAVMLLERETYGGDGDGGGTVGEGGWGWAVGGGLVENLGGVDNGTVGSSGNTSQGGGSGEV